MTINTERLVTWFSKLSILSDVAAVFAAVCDPYWAHPVVAAANFDRT